MLKEKRWTTLGELYGKKCTWSLDGQIGEDAKDWDDRLAEIESSADDLEWTHAATLLERLTKRLRR